VQRLLDERTVLLATIGRMERENSQFQAANNRLQQQLDTTLAELNVAEVELMRREANLDEAVAERQNVVDEYRQAREQLALQQAQNENYSETIAGLEARLGRETDAMNELQSQLQSLSNERQTLVSRLEDGTTVIKLSENIVFASGSADIGDAGRETLQLLADALESFPDHLISIQGHSDSRSISPTLQRVYPSNWELSTARAASAVRVLNESGINDERMQAVGYADTRPLVAETDPVSRRANRRIEVLLYPNQFTMRVLDQAGIDTP
jgi:chemotaxis protein MotB